MSSPSIIFLTRLLMVALEALFTFQSRTALRSNLDHVWEELFPWSKLDFGPLNSHTPLNEGPANDLDLSP